MKRTKEIFVENLRHLRESSGHTQATFAEKVGFSVRGYQKYEQGQSEATPDIVDLFSGALECHAKDLLMDPNELNTRSDLIASIVQDLGALDESELRAVRSLMDTALAARTARGAKLS